MRLGRAFLGVAVATATMASVVSAETRITVSCRTEGDTVVAAVQDDGPDIPAEEMAWLGGIDPSVSTSTMILSKLVICPTWVAPTS